MFCCKKCGMEFSAEDLWEVNIEEYDEQIILCYDCKSDLIDWIEGNDR